MLEQLNLVKLQEFTSLITKIELSSWGNELKLQCIYDPQGTKIPDQIHFQDCSEIQLSIHYPENIQDLEADVIDFQVGQEHQKEPAIIYTDIFELLITYGICKIENLSQTKIQNLS